MDNLANLVWEVWLFRVPFALSIFVYAGFFQLLWLNGRLRTRRESETSGAAGNSTWVKEIDTLVQFWVAAESCGLALGFAGVPIETCLAITIGIGFLCSLPSYYRIARRIGRRVPLLGSTYRASILFAARCIATIGSAIFGWVNRPALRADRMARRLVLTAVIWTVAAIAIIQLARLGAEDTRAFTAIAAVMIGFFVCVFTTGDELPPPSERTDTPE